MSTNKLLNYTTSVEVSKTIGEVNEILIRAGARSIRTDFDGAGNVTTISFMINTSEGEMAFVLPADPKPVLNVLNEQVAKKMIPGKYKHDVAQARRVAWRIVKDWLEAQLAMILTRMVTIEQVFLAYAVHRDTGKPFYAHLKETQFDGLARSAAPVKQLSSPSATIVDVS